MDRLSRPASPGGGYGRRGLYASHGSAQTSPGGSPTASPVHRHARSGSLGGAGAASTVGRRGRAHNTAARAAAQRLARVMASSDGAGGGDGGSGSDDDEYELSGPPIELSSTPHRAATRSPSTSIGRYLADQTPVTVNRPPSLTNRYMAGKSVQMIPSIKQSYRPVTSGTGSESPVQNRREQRSLGIDITIQNFCLTCIAIGGDQKRYLLECKKISAFLDVEMVDPNDMICFGQKKMEQGWNIIN